MSKTPGPGWTKIEDDGSVHISCPRCGWWIKLTQQQALGLEIINCPRCHGFNDFFPAGGRLAGSADFVYAKLPEKQHRDRSGVPR